MRDQKEKIRKGTIRKGEMTHEPSPPSSSCCVIKPMNQGQSQHLRENVFREARGIDRPVGVIL
jgi:hypothetical protein